MFKERFTRLCNERGESPSAVCVKLGLSNSTYSMWDENSMPRKATLLRMSDYFGVSVEYLKGESNEKNKALVFDECFTEKEKELVTAYRNHPEMHEAVHKILGMEEGEHNMANVFTSYNDILKEYFKIVLGQELHIKNPENAFGKLDEQLGVNGSVKWFHDINDSSLNDRVDEILTYVGKTYETIYDGKLFVIENAEIAKILDIEFSDTCVSGKIIDGKTAYEKLAALDSEQQQALKKAYIKHNISSTAKIAAKGDAEVQIAKNPKTSDNL